MNKKRITYLYISSWIGMSPEAVHFYGELQPGDYQNLKTVELTRILTQRDVTKLHKTIRHQYPGAYEMYSRGIRVGLEYKGFDTRDELRELAVTTFQVHFPESDILIEGESGIGDPQEILVGPDLQFITEANTIWREFESFEGYQYRKNERRAGELNDRWDRLFEELP